VATFVAKQVTTDMSLLLQLSLCIVVHLCPFLNDRKEEVNRNVQFKTQIHYKGNNVPYTLYVAQGTQSR